VAKEISSESRSMVFASSTGGEEGAITAFESLNTYRSRITEGKEVINGMA
jgi:hypothetical protein